MHVKITTSGSRRYVQLVESYRDDAGRIRKRTVATLGRLDQLGGELDSVISGLLKVVGRGPIDTATQEPSMAFESARALGDVWMLTELWKELGFGELRRVFRKTRHTIDVEVLIRIMVLNRLCDPESKLGVLRWLDGYGEGQPGGTGPERQGARCGRDGHAAVETGKRRQPPCNWATDWLQKAQKPAKLAGFCVVDSGKPLNLMVGARRLELPTPCTPCRCATRLRYAPTSRAL